MYEYEKYNSELFSAIKSEKEYLAPELRAFVDNILSLIESIDDPKTQNILLAKIYSFVRFPDTYKLYDLLRLLHATEIPKEKFPTTTQVTKIVSIILSNKSFA